MHEARRGTVEVNIFFGRDNWCWSNGQWRVQGRNGVWVGPPPGAGCLLKAGTGTYMLYMIGEGGFAYR